MREIEYRLYDDEGKFFYYGTMEDLMDCGHSNDFRVAYTEYHREGKEPPISQFTGLLDKNGKKIFEGDIIKTKFGVDVVDDIRDVFRTNSATYDGFGYTPNNFDSERGDCVVIGNIFQNKDMLK
jgi:uncharacterized phage protein (TIGR01671 family)